MGSPATRPAWMDDPIVEDAAPAEAPPAAAPDNRATFTMGGLTPALTHQGKVTPGEAVAAPALGALTGLGMAGAGALAATAPAKAAAAAVVPGLHKAIDAAWPYMKDVGGYYLADEALERLGVPAQVRGIALGFVFGKREAGRAAARTKPPTKPPTPRSPRQVAAQPAVPTAPAAPAQVAPATPQAVVTPKAATKPRASAKVDPEAQPVKVLDKGAAAAAEHKRLMAFAKEIAAKNPRAGERIWVELDAAGVPIRHLTPDQAGAVTRRGGRATWVSNVWGRR